MMEGLFLDLRCIKRDSGSFMQSEVWLKEKTISPFRIYRFMSLPKSSSISVLSIMVNILHISWIIWTASSEFGTYRICEQRRFRRACASAQSRQNLRCSLIQAVSQEEPSDRKPDPWPLWMAGHAQLKFVMTECSKTQICLTGLI